MRRCLAVLSLALVSVLSSTARAGSTPPPVADAREGWPATHAGEIASRWVTAFSTGEQAMREFNERWRVPGADAKASPNARIERYRDLREKYGTLSLLTVLASRDEEVKVRLMDSDGSPHEFVFRVQPKSPWKLVSIAMTLPGHDFGGMFGGFHH